MAKLRFSYLYQEPNDNLSGPGWSWSRGNYIGTQPQIWAKLMEMQRANAKSQDEWEHSDPKYRGAKWLPEYTDFCIEELVPSKGAPEMLALAAKRFDRMVAGRAAIRKRIEAKRKAETEARERALLADLKVRYPEDV